MRINIISLNNKHSLSEDTEMIFDTLKKLYSRKKKLQFEFANFHKNIAKVADVNIYLGIINNSFFKYAPINILILDQHKFDKVWIPYLKRLDYIISKNDYTKTILENYVPKEKIINIGWKKTDKYIYAIEKKFNEYIFILGQSNFRLVKQVLDLWQKDYPNLTIVSGLSYYKNNNIEKKEQDNIKYIEQYQTATEYLQLINEKSIHLCLTSCSSFANTLHDCITSKGIPIALDTPPFREYVTNNVTGFLVKQKKKKKLKNSLGSEFTIDTENLKEVIERVNTIIKTDELKLEEMGEKGQRDNLQNDRTFDRNLKDFFDTIWDLYKTKNQLKNNYECFDEDFPPVSIITPTYNRKYLFDLAIRNFTKTDYPMEKIEWIIVDDSENENLEDILPNNKNNNNNNNNNIKYIKLDERKSIGEKRNIAVENSKYDIIVCMDDDDYYPPMSVKTRVASLLHLNKKVVGCTGLGLFEVNKIISAVSFSSYVLDYYNRFFESTLTFYKSLWENNKFSDTNNNEGRGLIEGNILETDEIMWNNVIVSLSHYNNTNKRLQIRGDTNGSHFKLPEEVFNLVTSIDNKDDIDGKDGKDAKDAKDTDAKDTDDIDAKPKTEYKSKIVI